MHLPRGTQRSEPVDPYDRALQNNAETVAAEHRIPVDDARRLVALSAEIRDLKAGTGTGLEGGDRDIEAERLQELFDREFSGAKARGRPSP